MPDDTEIDALLEVAEPMSTWEWPDPDAPSRSVIFTLGILMTTNNGDLWRVELTDIRLTAPGNPWHASWFRPDPFDPGMPFMPISRFIALAKNGRIRQARE